jgi:cytochrome d ubiquinol oxidase subunit I
VYGVLAVIEVKLLLTYIRRGADEVAPDEDPSAPHTDDRPLAFAY